MEGLKSLHLTKSSVIVLSCIVLLFSPLFSSEAWSGTEETLTLNTADTSPYSTKGNTGLYDRLLMKLFDTIEIKVSINHLPSARSIENVDIGLDDGEYARIKGLGEKYSNIRIVDEKLIDFAFTAFAKTAIKINSWDSLRNYNVAYLRGWKIYEKNVKGPKSIQVSSSEEELFNLLQNDRVDIILYERLRGVDYMKKHGVLGIQPLKEPLAVRGMYLYLNKAHEQLIPKVEESLKMLKSNGEYDEIVNSFLY